jgi:hypothetical protein
MRTREVTGFVDRLVRGGRGTGYLSMSLRLAVALCWTVNAARGQGRVEPRPIPNGCTECGAEWSLLTRVDGRAVPDLVSYPLYIARTGSGLLVVNPDFLQPPAVFDARGAFVGKLGRLGDGPGELNMPTNLLAGRGDTLTVYSPTRVTRFDVKSRTAVDQNVLRQSLPLQGLLSARIDRLSSGLVLYSSNRCSDQRGGAVPCRIVVEIRNATDRLSNPTLDSLATTGLAAAVVRSARRPGHFWLAQRTTDERGYSLTLYDTLGVRKLVFERRPADWKRVRNALSGNTQVSRVQDLVERANGELVVAIVQPKPILANSPTAQPDDVAETLVETLDVTSGKVVGHKTWRAYPVRLFEDGSFALYRSAEDSPILEIWGVGRGSNGRGPDFPTKL